MTNQNSTIVVALLVLAAMAGGMLLLCGGCLLMVGSAVEDASRQMEAERELAAPPPPQGTPSGAGDIARQIVDRHLRRRGRAERAGKTLARQTKIQAPNGQPFWSVSVELPGLVQPAEVVVYHRGDNEWTVERVNLPDR